MILEWCKVTYGPYIKLTKDIKKIAYPMNARKSFTKYMTRAEFANTLNTREKIAEKSSIRPSQVISPIMTTGKGSPVGGGIFKGILEGRGLSAV